MLVTIAEKVTAFGMAWPHGLLSLSAAMPDKKMKASNKFTDVQT